MYDNVCKFLAENFSADLASWLLGQPIAFTQLSPTELNVEPIRADSLILLDSPNLLLHLEFQTNPDAGIPARMANYRLRIHARFPHKAVRQIVIYLKPTRSRLVYETSFEISGLRHEFEVIRLWEQPVEAFLQSPGLLPFAILANTSERVEVLRQVADRAEAIAETSVRADVMAASAVLAGLVLEKDSIRQILRSDAMRESVIYQDILQEGERKGLQEGERRGLQEGERRGLQRGLLTTILRLMVRKFGQVDGLRRDRIEKLSVELLGDLTEAILDFERLEDFDTWLGDRSA
jgi:predicted transposase/invertase (TIGR01784 family)